MLIVGSKFNEKSSITQDPEVVVYGAWCMATANLKRIAAFFGVMAPTA
jgi:hypothetical protein